jgi:hypothetical protein
VNGTAFVGLPAASPVGGCTNDQVAPGACTTVPPGSFDRSGSMAVIAFDAPAVTVARTDRGAGGVRASRGGINATANVRVDFGASGATSQDPGLIDRRARVRPAYGPLRPAARTPRNSKERE